MLRRIIPVIALLFLVVSVASSHAQDEGIFQALKALNSSRSLSSPGSPQAQEAARGFFSVVQSQIGEGGNVINALKELKRRNGHRWSEVETAESGLMAVVKQVLEGQIRGVVEGRAGSGTLGSINGYGYSGKWPLKPANQLTFDSDFDVTFFSSVMAEVNPDLKTSIVGELSGNIRRILGVNPEGLSIVVTGAGYEARADVYVSRAAIKWAVIQSMTRLYLIDAATGRPIEITGSPEQLFFAVQMQLLQKSHPELFERGRLKPGVTPEQVRQMLISDPSVSETYKIFLEGTSYTAGQAAAATIDMACHTSETAEATTSLEIRTKVAKQVARSSHIFVNAMNTVGNDNWRQFFSAEDLQFMRVAATLDRAKMTYAEAESARIKFLLESRNMGPLTDFQQAEYQKLKTAAEQAREHLESVERDVMRQAGGEAGFTRRALEIMRRQGQVAHRENVIQILNMPASERAAALAEYEAELRRVLEHYRKRGAPAETIQWAERAANATGELARINRENAKAMEGIGAKLVRIYEMFSSPVNTRENVKNLLGETPIGKALLERIPEWAFASERPAAITDIAFDAPTKMVAEVVVAPVNQMVNGLMMIDLLLQLSDVWSSNQTNVQKLVATGEITAMLVIPHLYLVPAVYHASLQGDPKQLTYIMACYICPPAMLPMLVESLGTRAVSGAKRALFQAELEAMFQASAFTPEDGKEPKEWATDRDAVRYSWIALYTETDSYGRSGERGLASYIRILASDTRAEVPLSQPKKMSGLQAIYLPGGVAKSFRAMIQDGDHRLFQENQALAQALAELQKFNCDRLVPYMDKAPAYCRYAWAEQKSGIRLDLINNDFAEGEEARIRAEGKAGENMANIVRAMLQQRAKLQDQVIETLAEAIIVSFEEEKRARKLVELGLLDENLKELLEIGEELNIREELREAVSEALRLRGAKVGADRVGKPTADLKEETRKEMAKVTDQWLRTYRYVADTRRTLTGLTGGYGVPRTDLDHFLRGKPPLQVEPGKDAEATKLAQEVVLRTPKDTSGILFRFKGNRRDANPLDNEAERELLKYLFTARVMELTVDEPYGMIPLWQEGPAEGEKPEAYAERARSGLKRQLDMKRKSFWGSAPDFSDFLDRYYLLARGYAGRFAELRERYQEGFQLAVEGPSEAEAEKDVTLKAVPTRNGKPADDVLQNTRIEWVVGNEVLSRGSSWWFSPLKEETVTVTARAVRDVGGKTLTLATATHQLVVRKKQEEKKPGEDPADKDAPDKDKTDSGKKDDKKVAPSCSYKYSAWGECSRATKKQTRTVTAKEPAGCVERGKPALEQGCTPPPTEEEKRLAFLSCLCRACGGTMGGYYNTGDSCGGSKPCACWGVFNCWATPIPRGADLIKSCYSSAYGVKEPGSDTLNKALEDVRKENRKHMKPLKVRLNHEKCPIHAQLGDIVNFYTIIEGGIPPHKVSWSGDGQAKDQQFTFANSRKPGTHAISATVSDDDGNSATASCPVVVDAITVKIEKTSPAAETLPVGGKASFRAVVMSGSNTAGGTLKFQWQPHPEVQFTDGKNPLFETTSPNTAATYTKTGTFRMWVQVLKKMGETWQTVGESDQITMQVVNPRLELTFSPKEPWVGQEVKAKLSVKPEVKEIDFRWMPVPGNAKQSMESKDGKEITFYLKDDKAAEIHVMARVPKSGEDLGEAKGTVKAKRYAVSVTGPKAYGPKPRVWKEGVGLVDVENAIAVDQIVEFAANIQPAPLTGPVKYQWSVTGGPCTVSNPTSREARATAGSAGGCELTVAVRDRNDVPLGEGRGSFSASVTREAIATGQKKAKDTADAKTKVADAKAKARKGDYDGAIKDAEDAARLDPANKEASATAGKLRKEKETIHQQIDKAKKLMDENRFADAQKELIVASNLNSYYPLVPAANQELGTRWNKYNSEVRDKVYEVRSANEKKDFGKALELAAAWRASTKLDPYADEQLKQQENWAKQWKAQKERQIGILKEAGEKVKSCDYAGALKQYEEGFANGQNLYNGTEPEYKEAVALRSQAFTKNKRLVELTPHIRNAAENKDSYYGQTHVLDGALKAADEAIALQPNNEQLKTWREQIVARAEKTKADNERIAAGRKYLDAARSEENTYLSQVSYVQSDTGRWGENVEADMQSHVQKAIDNYRASLQYIPDANVEKKIKELEATLEGRKKHLESYRLSVTLKNEADALVQQATKDPDIQTAAPLYDQAIEKYRRSLSLYRPSNAEMIERQAWNLEYGKHDRWVKKYWADGQALEKEAKYAAALAAYDRAIASFHPTVPQNDRMWIVVHAQDLRNRINGAKNLRADGEAKQNAGRVAEAIASYRQSLKLLPDPALEEHVRMLEGKQAEAGEKKVAADRLWQEGTALFNQGRPSDALAKFKESLGYWSDSSRQKYAADLEARRAKAVALRDEGSKLQNQNRIAEAVAKYRESLTYWPDSGLSSHIATLEGKLKQDADAAARKARAKQLRDEGYALQQRNQLQAAIGKYRESLAVWPDPQLEAHIAKLEKSLAGSPSGAVTGAGASVAGSTVTAGTGFYLVDLTPCGGKKGTPRKVKNIEVDDGSWIRLKATHEKKLTLDIPLPQRVSASAVAVVSNLDNAHNVPDKMTTTVLTVHTTSGDRTFELKAGVHSSEWNRGETSGATHAWPKETNIGGSRWMAVFSLPSGSVVTGLRFDHRDTDKKYYHGDAAPGFCLRGITLVGSPVGTASTGTVTTSTGSWAGSWKSDPGPDGEVVIFNLSQSGSRLTGGFQVDVPYTAASGARQKETLRGALEGTVSGSRVTGTFRESSDTKPAGSFEFTMAASGNLFTALVRGEDTSDTYTVRRGSSSVSSGSSATSGQTAARAVMAELTNRSRENTHIFAEGETFGPGNRLAPGERRKVAVTMKPDGSVTFKAGRNGQVMATKIWRGTPGDTTRVPVVVFDDTNPYDKLTVTTGLR